MLNNREFKKIFDELKINKNDEYYENSEIRKAIK